MFPNPYHANTLLPQLARDSCMTLLVTLDFGAPEFTACSGNMPTLRATMPKASINEQGDLSFRKVEVWSSGQVLRLKFPTTNTATRQKHTHGLFGGPVPLAANG